MNGADGRKANKEKARQKAALSKTEGKAPEIVYGFTPGPPV